MRIRWSNRIAIVDGLLECKNLKAAREMAQEILTDVEASFMLSDEEEAYLKLVVVLEEIIDIPLSEGDESNGD